MSETPVSPDPGRDATPPGEPGGPGDYPWLGSPDWTLVPDSAQRPAWQDDDAFWAGEEDPGDPEEYEDPDNAPPPGLDDGQLAALIAGGRAAAAEQARAGQGRGAAGARRGAGRGRGGGRGAAGSGDARVGAGLPPGVHQPGVGVRVG